MKHATSPELKSGGWRIECAENDPLRGLGCSSSSNLLVLFAAARSCILSGPNVRLDPDDITRQALAWERIAARGAAVAANDVRPMVGGGVGVTHTFPLAGRSPRRDGNGLPVETRYERIRCDQSQLARHVIVAFNRAGVPHHVPDLLQTLFEDPEAASFVRRINRLTDDAVAGVRSNAFGALASAINRYRDVFDRWTDGAFTREVQVEAESLLRRFGRGIRGWKPCGAGACKSIIVVVDKPDRAVAVVKHLKATGWDAGPLEITEGLRAVVSHSGRTIRISAGHRVDLIGAADLGQDPRIGVAGRCLACAVFPRTEWVLSFPVPLVGGASLIGSASVIDTEVDEAAVASGGNGSGRAGVPRAFLPLRTLGTAQYRRRRVRKVGGS